MNSNCELEDELRLFCSDPKTYGKFFIAESFFVVVLRACVRACARLSCPSNARAILHEAWPTISLSGSSTHSTGT